MQGNRKINRPSRKYLARSAKGQWIKSISNGDGIEVFWKPRFVIKKNLVKKLDFNGDVESVSNIVDVDWGNEWISAGEICLSDSVVEICGLENFDAFVYGLMRHVVGLMICGYGDEPCDVVRLFDDIKKQEFIVEGGYRIVGDHGDISGLVGNNVAVSMDSCGGKMAEFSVLGSDFGKVELNSIFTSFVIATIPI